MRDYLSKATLVPNAEFFATDEALLDRLKDPAWNPRASVLLGRPVTITVPPSQGSPGTSSDVELKTYTSTEIDLEAETAQSGFVLINDQYDPDWQAQVNGHDVPLLRADYIMRAVAIPAGWSKITLRYVAHYHVAGLNLPAEAVNNFSDDAMLAAWLIAGFALGVRRPRVKS